MPRLDMRGEHVRGIPRRRKHTPDPRRAKSEPEEPTEQPNPQLTIILLARKMRLGRIGWPERRPNRVSFGWLGGGSGKSVKSPGPAV